MHTNCIQALRSCAVGPWPGPRAFGFDETGHGPYNAGGRPLRPSLRRLNIEATARASPGLSTKSSPNHQINTLSVPTSHSGLPRARQIDVHVPSVSRTTTYAEQMSVRDSAAGAGVAYMRSHARMHPTLERLNVGPVPFHLSKSHISCLPLAGCPRRKHSPAGASLHHRRPKIRGTGWHR